MHNAHGVTTILEGRGSGIQFVGLVLAVPTLEILMVKGSLHVHRVFLLSLDHIGDPPGPWTTLKTSLTIPYRSMQVTTM